MESVLLDFLIRLVINSAAVMAAVRIVPGVRFSFGDDWWKLLAVGLVLGAVNSYLRPIVRLLSLPVRLFAIGLVGLAINVAMLLLVALVSRELRLGFSLAGWPGGPFTVEVLVTALLASLVISAVATVLSLAFAGRRVLGGWA